MWPGVKIVVRRVARPGEKKTAAVVLLLLFFLMALISEARHLNLLFLTAVDRLRHYDDDSSDTVRSAQTRARSYSERAIRAVLKLDWSVELVFFCRVYMYICVVLCLFLIAANRNYFTVEQIRARRS